VERRQQKTGACVPLMSAKLNIFVTLLCCNNHCTSKISVLLTTYSAHCVDEINILKLHKTISLKNMKFLLDY